MMNELFRRGDLVTLRDVDPGPLGRVITVTPAGDQAEVAWYRDAGHEHQVTLEPTLWLRRVHESEMSAGEQYPDDAATRGRARPRRERLGHRPRHVGR